MGRDKYNFKMNFISKKQFICFCILLTVVTFAVYSQVTGHDFINYDDTVYVTQNSHVQSGLTPNSIRWAFITYQAQFWHPLTWLSLMFDYQLYGPNAGGYHLTNLILHILSTLLLFWLFCRMTGALWKSAFVAAVFAIHPLHVESVAWVAERKDVLSAFFWMLTLCLYVYYTQKPVLRRYLLVLISFVLGLMSKSMLVTLPFVMILLDYWPLSRYQIGIGLQKGNLILWQLKEKLPFLFFSAVFSVITIFVQPVTHLKDWPPPLESRIINALGSFVIYLEKIFWPQDLAACYPFSGQASAWQVSGAVLLILIISIAVIFNIKRFPYLFVGWFWYSVALLPVIGIIPVGNNAIADRYMYLPSIGISIMLAWGVPFLFKSENIRKNILLPAVLIILTILSVLAWRQCAYWKNDIVLWNYVLKVTKDNALAHSNLGIALSAEGEIYEAINHYNKAISISPTVTSYNNRGNAFAILGRYQNAIEDYNEAIRLNPDDAETYNNRGNIFAILGQYQNALMDYNKSISLDPNSTEAYCNRGNVYIIQKNNEQGCSDLKKASEYGSCQLLEIAKSKGYCY